MARTWTATHEGEIAETAATLKDLMWLLSCNHEDPDAKATRTGTPGLRYYTAPRGGDLHPPAQLSTSLARGIR